MNEILTATVTYFQSPQHYFWRWAERGEVIEWQNGSTICYREELMTVLQGLATQGMPPIGTLLLTLTACQDNWKESSGGVEVLRGLAREMQGSSVSPHTEDLEYLIPLVVKLMDVIQVLPRELRSGVKKIHLIHEVFSKSAPAIAAEQALSIMDEFGSGRVDELILKEGEKITRQQFKTDLSRLILAMREFQDNGTLETRLRTGVTQLPKSVEVPLPEPEPLDLMAQLAEDTKTVGVARLTQRLIAALHIPMHTHGASNQSYGGISDITNRGNFDRLLLSELAQDDLSLLARLVNNEALYLRREEPPDRLNRQRTILLDTTIKMWGLPRVFAISAALACTLNDKQLDQVQAYALAGTDFTEIDLTSKKGLLQTLERLDAGLHCGRALTLFMQQQPVNEQTEYMLITDAELLQTPEFQHVLSELKQALTFLITVSRNGELQFYAFRQGQSRLVSAVKFDLDELLFAPATPPKQMKRSADQPAYLTIEPGPLYFPTSGMRLSDKNTFYEKEIGVIGVSEIQRILYWPKKETGARELLNYIESGDYCFGSDRLSTAYILVNNADAEVLKLYTIHTLTDKVEVLDLFKQIGRVSVMVFHEGMYYVKPKTGFVSVSCATGKVTECGYSSQIGALFSSPAQTRIDFNQVKRHINNGYNVLHRIKNIYVNERGTLSLDVYHIDLINNNIIKLVENRRDGVEKSRVSEDMEASMMLTNPRIRFRRTMWPDGSVAIVDSRGLLHLRSSDVSIPEITLVLIIGKATACWASDGMVTGSFYFTGIDPAKSMTAPDFYRNYIKRFVDRLS
jgi:hypothetical protein